MEIRWTLQEFSELTNSDLYELLKLRSAIFVVEQNCVFPDMDDKDYSSYHLCGWNNEKLVAYTRLLPPGLAYENCSIGRVVTAASVRRQGIGKILMKKSIEACQQLFSSQDIEIGAQLYLEQFYGSFQFIREGEVYLEDGIDHIHMRRPLH
ncbi:MAG: GNAT family N-acetyltransferase [Chitinophagaceae bacterium]|jgi:ElaA protein|nr:GNAT family N-acetyltransferase [Chitinophagaceae bacterium]